LGELDIKALFATLTAPAVVGISLGGDIVLSYTGIWAMKRNFEAAPIYGEKKNDGARKASRCGGSIEYRFRNLFWKQVFYIKPFETEDSESSHDPIIEK
jgi:hypothetical protein